MSQRVCLPVQGAGFNPGQRTQRPWAQLRPRVPGATGTPLRHTSEAGRSQEFFFRVISNNPLKLYTVHGSSHGHRAYLWLTPTRIAIQVGNGAFTISGWKSDLAKRPLLTRPDRPGGGRASAVLQPTRRYDFPASCCCLLSGGSDNFSLEK